MDEGMTPAASKRERREEAGGVLGVEWGMLPCRRDSVVIFTVLVLTLRTAL